MRRNIQLSRVIRFISVLALCTLLFLLAVALAGLTSAAAQPQQAAELAAAPLRPVVAPSSVQWQVVNSPSVGTMGSSLHSVTGNSANDVTAVGSYIDSSNHSHTLIEHWNGSVWSIVPSQDPDPSVNGLVSVASDMGSGYWAAGTSLSSAYGALIERQTTPGGTWSLVPVPSISNYPTLSGISADALNDAWAVGNHGGDSGYANTLILHWDGTIWSTVTSPNPSAGNNELTGVVAVNADNKCRQYMGGRLDDHGRWHQLYSDNYPLRQHTDMHQRSLPDGGYYRPTAGNQRQA